MNISIQEKIQKITTKIAETYQPEKVFLFGSYAWGKPTKDSDIDLFVVKDTKESKRERQIKLRRLFLDFDMPADILVYTPKEVEKRIMMGDFFVKNIITKGKILYAK